MEIRNKAGDVVRRSQNLRGLMSHARLEVPFCATLQECQDGYALSVYFRNGDRADSPFASATVCAEFLAGRRTWPTLAVFGPPEFVARYHSLRGETETLRTLLADMVSANSRGASSGNPWRSDALRRAARYLNRGDWTGEAYRVNLSPMERKEREG